MSAHALNDPSRRIVIQDELESFFQVLLYYAVRFLPHNPGNNNVDQFLHDYFDTYCPHVEDYYHCGRAKFEAMRIGAIQIMSYRNDQDTEHSKLRFLWLCSSARKPDSPALELGDRSSSPAPPEQPASSGTRTAIG